MRVRPFSRLAGATVAAIVLFASACLGPPEAVRYEDLVAEERLLTDDGPAPVEPVLCADETYAAVSLADSQALRATVDLGTDASVHLAACMACLGDPRSGGALVAVVRNADQRRTDVRLDLAPFQRWQSVDVPLDRIRSGPIHIGVEAEAPDGCQVHVKDVVVEHTAPAPARAEGSPVQILLISVDTLRADVLGEPDSPVDTPNLDRLVAEGESWARHAAASHWTKPSHASMLTGVPVQVHGATTRSAPIHPGLRTVAERLREVGLLTGALVYDTPWLKPEYGFARGFESYEVRHWRVEKMVRATSDWLLDHRDQPFFFFLHTFEVHSDPSLLPYEAPGLTREVLERELGRSDLSCRGDLCADSMLGGLATGEVPVRNGDPEAMRYMYHASVRYLDRELGRLFDTLRTNGCWDDLLVVVTSDHGEEFFEHGRFSHRSAYEEVLRVPLVIKWPGGRAAGVRHHHPTTAIDLAPTLLEAAGADTGELPGIQLYRRLPDDPVFAGTSRVVYRGVFKGVVHGVGVGDAVFDLAADPDERQDLSAASPAMWSRAKELVAEQARRERRARAELEAAGSQPVPVELSAEEEEKLRALGYLED